MNIENLTKARLFRWAFIITILVNSFSASLMAQQNPPPSSADTVFNKLSVEDLIRIRSYFNQRVDKIRQQQESARVDGMEWSESFLGEKGKRIKERDKVYVRLAEYYIDDAERQYELKVDKYEEKFQLYEEQLARFDRHEIDQEPAAPEFPKYDYSAAIGVYQRILQEYPASDYADDALYNIGWLKEKMGEGDVARQIYNEVIDKYPDSPFAAESYMRLAEYYFAPREDKSEENESVVELLKAIQLYKNVLRFRESKRYDEALYKLGWSYYKLAARDPKYYNDAITYFIAVADDITRSQKLDPRKKISNPDVRDEAIEYIGISFTDEAYTSHGVDKARSLLERIGGREYGPELMQAIGSTFLKIDEQNKAIYAFETLLEMYPDYREAPFIQQSIVNALFNLGQDERAYQAREALYRNYGPQSEWYQNLERSDNPERVNYLKRAYKLSEAALRTNILLDLEKGEAAAAANLPSKSLYEKFAKNAEFYMAQFPADSNTYDINWSYAFMLDSRLGRFEEAFDEYIRVSNDYLETSHQHDAALNAVAVADTLVEMKYGFTDSVNFNLADVARLNPESLTPEETRLIEAYDNYIRLFPTGNYTPNFLAAAGGIYYNHKKFAEAKVYFQTLVKRFPNAEEKSLAMRSIMDSYFALGKFKDSEIIAKRILNETNISDEQRDFALKRMGQAIFKNAEFLEEQGDYFNAANEYLRVYKEASGDQRLVEAALYNSGLNFQRAKDWVRAIESFDVLASNYPDAKYSVDALENMAKAYIELDQFANAGQVYERIFSNYRETENAETALYNSAYWYKKGEDWTNSIRIGNLYIANFPDQPYSTDLYFNNAELYLKLDNVVEANRIYEEFASKYPDDPRTVTAFFERGKYYFKNGMIEQAKKELNAAIARSEQLRRAGKDANPYIAGEAVNKLADILHQEFVSIQLRQPRSEIDSKLARMRTLMTELNEAYSKVIAFGSPRSFEATYNIARTYEEFAQIIKEQEIDQNLSEDKQFVERKRINEQAAGLYDKAVDQYKEVVQNIPILAEKLGFDMFTPDTLQATAADTAALIGISRVAEIDSTRQLALKWHGKARDKISQLLYTEASLTSENVAQALNIESPHSNAIQSIIYKLKVLKEIADPAINATISAHLRNIKEAEALGLSNKYIEESKRQILLTSNLMGSEVEVLVYTALGEYENTESQIEDLVAQEFGAVNSLNQDYYALDNIANQLIDYSRILSNDVMKTYIKTLSIADENGIKNDLVRNTNDRMLRFAVEVTDKMQDLADYAKERSTFFKTRFDSTENYNYDDATGFFENYFYSFNGNAKEILEGAFDATQTYNIKNLWANKLLYKLIKLDPATYSASIEKEKMIITTDNSWRYSIVYYPEQWTLPDFDDSQWEFAREIFSPGNPFSAYGVDAPTIWNGVDLGPGPSTADTLSQTATDTTQSSAMPGDSLVSADSMAAVVSRPDSIVFFRKTIDIEGTPVSGFMLATADDDYRIYLNGEYIIDDEANDFNVADSLDYYTFDLFLKKGKNVIAIDVEDKDLTAGGLKFYFELDVLPADVTTAAEEKSKEEKVIVDPAILERINILNKNRISLQK